MKDLTDLQHEVMLQAHRAGYVATLNAMVLVVRFAIANGEKLTPLAADARARRVLNRLVVYGLLQLYVKDKGIRVYGITTRGAAYLRGTTLDDDVKPTLTVTAQAKHVAHRIVADAITQLIALKHRDTLISSLTERQVLTGAAPTFKSDFRKLPDGVVINSTDRSFVAVEVDTVRRSRVDQATLLRALRAMDSVVPGSAVADRNYPACLLWVVPHRGEGAYQTAERALLASGFKPREEVGEQGVYFGTQLVVVLARFDFRQPYIDWLQALVKIAYHPYVELP